MTRRAHFDPDLSCKRKKAYTKAVAKAKARSRSARERIPQSAYKCLHCGAWHVGHMPREIRQINWEQGRRRSRWSAA